MTRSAQVSSPGVQNRAEEGRREQRTWVGGQGDEDRKIPDIEIFTLQLPRSS